MESGVGKRLMEIIEKRVDELIPYANNPRNNMAAVDSVAQSIKSFGFLVPIIIDKNNVIVAGHTRLYAAKELGLEKVPCISAEDLTEDQVKKFRLVDNKTAEIAEWDFELLKQELAEITGINMAEFGFMLDDIKKYKETAKKEVEAVKKIYCPRCGKLVAVKVGNESD